MTKKTKAKTSARRKVATKLDGYKGLHRAGSRKGKVREAYDKSGAEAARKLGAKLKLSDATLSTWITGWGGVSGGGKKKAA